jgi:hypothetical protein
MVVTPHALVGAATSRLCNSSAEAFGLGVVSHLLSDKIPHTDYECFSKKGFLKLAADFGCATLLLNEVQCDQKGLWGALGGITPDLLTAPGRKLHIPGTRSLTRFHDWNHTKNDRKGKSNIATQAALALLGSAIYLLLEGKRVEKKYLT